MLQQFGPDIWFHDGSDVVGMLGFHYPTRMAVIRLADGGLVILSPTELTAELKQAVDALGPVRCLVAPNTLHHVFIGEWSNAWPNARLFALPELQARLADLKFDGEI